MTEIAEVINLEEHRPVVKADTSEGFIMIASTINAELGRFGVYKLNGRERALIDCVIHKTFGFKKKLDWISEAQFAEFMGLSEGTKGNINKIKNALIRRKILICEGRKIGINTIISEWLPFENQSKTTENKTSQKRLQNQSNLTGEQSKTTEKEVKNDLHNIKETNTKETITKDNSPASTRKPSKSTRKPKPNVQAEILNLELPDGLSYGMWKNWVEYRAEAKKPMTLRAAQMQLKLIADWYSKGHNIDQIITMSIANSYQGLFEPKGGTSKPNGYQTNQERIREQNMQTMSDWANRD